MPKKSEIRVFHIEATSKCNLTCPQCARSPGGFINPILPMDELSIEDYKKVFDPDFCKQLDQIYFNGNYGDPASSTNLYEAISWMKSNGAKQVNFFTNGSLRTPAWWESMAKLLTGKNDYVVFGIDGLADTNHIYRRGSNFEKIMENVQAFINAGGIARWDFIRFKHNVHQEEDAKELARKMGFKKFNAKGTARFLDETAGEIVKVQLTNAESRAKKATQPGADNFNLVELERAEAKDKIKDSFDKVIAEHGTFENYVDVGKITCKSTESGNQYGANVFMDFKGKIWPCCWMGCLPYIADQNYLPKKQILKLMENYEEGFNDIKLHTLDEVLAHKWYESDLQNSWDNTTKDEVNPRIFTCGRTCGSKFDWSSGASGNNVESTKLK